MAVYLSINLHVFPLQPKGFVFEIHALPFRSINYANVHLFLCISITAKQSFLYLKQMPRAYGFFSRR
jgi:hypothetical protein